MPMKVSELIKELEKAQSEFGDIEVKLWVSSFEYDDTVLKEGELSLSAFPHERLGIVDFIISGDTAW